MEDLESAKFNPMNKVDDSALPDDSITIILKCGGRTYAQGVNMPFTQEATAKVAGILMQKVIDTIDAKGLKAGGSRFDPNNKEASNE